MPQQAAEFAQDLMQIEKSRSNHTRGKAEAQDVAQFIEMGEARLPNMGVLRLVTISDSSLSCRQDRDDSSIPNETLRLVT